MARTIHVFLGVLLAASIAGGGGAQEPPPDCNSSPDRCAILREAQGTLISSPASPLRDQLLQWLSFTQANLGDAEGLTLSLQARTGRMAALTADSDLWFSAEQLFQEGYIKEGVWLVGQFASAGKRGATLASHADDLLAKGYGQELLSAIESMPAGEETNWAQSALAVALARSGEMGAAIERAQNLPEPCSSEAQREIAEDLLKKGKVDEATQLAVSIRGDRPRNNALSAVAEYWCGKADFLRAHLSIDRITATDIRDEALRRMAASQARNGHTAEAFQTLSEIRDPMVAQWTRPEIARNIAERGDVAGAVTLAQAFADTEDRDHALDQIADIQERAGDLSGAVETLLLMNSPNNRGWRLRFLAGELARSGNLETARRALLQSQEDAPRVTHWRPESGFDEPRDVAIAWAELGETAPALNYCTGLADYERATCLWDTVGAQVFRSNLSEAVRIAFMIEDYDLRARALDMLARAFERKGDKVQAADMWREAIAAEACAGNRPDPAAGFPQSRFAGLTETAGATEALRVADSLPEFEPKCQAYRAIAGSLGEADSVREARSWIDDPRYSAFKPCALLGLAEGLRWKAFRERRNAEEKRRTGGQH